MGRRERWGGEMSLEDAVHRLANAVGMQEQTAVKEIIRQRDSALSDFANMKSRSEMYQRWYEDKKRDCEHLGRVIASLRGVVTKMKRARAQEPTA